MTLARLNDLADDLRDLWKGEGESPRRLNHAQVAKSLLTDLVQGANLGVLLKGSDADIHHLLDARSSTHLSALRGLETFLLKGEDDVGHQAGVAVSENRGVEVDAEIETGQALQVGVAGVVLGRERLVQRGYVYDALLVVDWGLRADGRTGFLLLLILILASNWTLWSVALTAKLSVHLQHTRWYHEGS